MLPAHLIALLLLLMPQGPPIHVTINVYGGNVSVGEPLAAAPPTGEFALEFLTSCDATSQALWLDAGYPVGVQPLDVPASATNTGDFCDAFGYAEVYDKRDVGFP